eukprot:scpid96671/ scgid29648/ Zinc finger MYM-type protein 1
MLGSVRFLACHSLVLRGHGDDADSNFLQLLRLRWTDCSGILSWLEKKANMYVSPQIQNECLNLLCMQLLRKVSSCIQDNRYYCIMVDECTDSSNKEQFTLCIRWAVQHFMCIRCVVQHFMTEKTLSVCMKCPVLIKIQ